MNELRHCIFGQRLGKAGRACVRAMNTAPNHEARVQRLEDYLSRKVNRLDVQRPYDTKISPTSESNSAFQ